MANKKGNIDPKAIADSFADKIKNNTKGGNIQQEIMDSIWELLGSNGIEIPDKVKQAIKEYQPKK